MLKKRYKNKGIPKKGSEPRVVRTLRLSDSAWAGITEVAEVLNISRGDLIEWWTAVITQNEEKLKEIAANENINLDELTNLQWERMPDIIRQLQANEPPEGLVLQMKPAKDDDQQQQSVSTSDSE